MTRIGRGVPIKQEPKPKRWFGIKPEFVIAAAVVIAVAMMVTAVFVFDNSFVRKPDGTFMIAGKVWVSGSGSNLAFGSSTGECRGKGGYEDLHEGAPVAVADASGRTVAIGQLGPGESTTAPGIAEGSPVLLVACTFPVEVLDVPEGERFYRITLTHRGAVEYSREQLRQPLALTIG